MAELDEKAQVTMVYSTADTSKITLRDVPDQPGVAAQILAPVADSDILVDIIVQNISSKGLTDFTLTVASKQADKTLQLLSKVATKLKAGELERDDDIAKITLIGSAMRTGVGIASQAFQTLADESINIQTISTTDIKIEVVVAQRYEELAVRVLHHTFIKEKT